MLEVNEALAITLETIEELKQAGVSVTTKVPRSVEKAGAFLADLIARYAPPERLSVEKWLHVTFTIRNHHEADLVFEAAKGLSWRGIRFDSGGFSGYRDWELDWSFRCVEGPDSDAEASMEVVEDLIRSQGLGKVDDAPSGEE
jgi:hypothetical protein